jgi:hypothetical protein
VVSSGVWGLVGGCGCCGLCGWVALMIRVRLPGIAQRCSITVVRLPAGTCGVICLLCVGTFLVA